MARDLQIAVKLRTELQNARDTLSTHEDKFTGKNIVKLTDLFKELDRLLKSDSFSLKELQTIGSRFGDVTKILKDVGLATGEFSDELKDLIDQQTKAQDKLNIVRIKRDTARSKGKMVETESGGSEFQLYDSYLNKLTAKEGIKYKGIKGSPQDLKTYKTLVKRVDQVKSGDKQATEIFATQEDYEKALALVERIKTIRQLAETEFKDTAIELQKAVEDYNNITNKVKEKEKTDPGKSPIFDAGSNIHENVSNLITAESDFLRDEKERKETTTQINALNTSLNKQQTALSKAFKQFTIYNFVLRSVKMAARAAVQTIKELDKSLTEQAMVTGMTRKEAYELVGAYQELALKVGATTKEVASVATEYMKQGKTIEDSLKLTEAAVAAAKVARVSVGDSVNYLTTALNGFRLSAEDAMLVSDKFAAVAASSATDYDELAIALSKVASQANLAGMSIDYTTALLTKGLETTREAPETMGTALKTIIARMRELGDYGETLEGDTDINNVESQLAYVGIALRNTNGELRSTEDVLDQLGRKWDTLNTNQQAALAKALAGTRQQSRLIAMMDDYERVIELQEISQRSAGATSAQAATYLEGIEASLNAISVAWEKIVTNVTNSEVIIWFLDRASILLDKAGWFLNSLWGQIPVFTLIGVAIAGIISKKLLENKIAKEQAELQRLQLKQELEKRKEYLIQEVLKKNNIKLEDAELKLLYAKYHAQVAINNAKKGKSGKKDIAKAKENEKEAETLAKVKDAQALVNAEIASGSELGLQLASTNEQLNLLMQKGNALSAFSYMWMSLKNTAQGFWNLMLKASIPLEKMRLKLTKKQTEAQIANNAAVAANPYIAAALAVLAVLAAIGALIVLLTDLSSKTEKTSKEIGKLSNEIYKLNESATSIKKAASELEEFDNKVVKTKEDLEAMEEVIDSVSESIDWTQGGTLSDEEAEDLKKDFESWDPKTQRKWLEDEAERLEGLIKAKRQKQIDILKALNEEDRNYLLKNDNNTISAVRANNNALLYEEIDNLEVSIELTEEQIKATEDLGQRILDNLSAEEAYLWMTTDGAKKLVETLSKLEDITVSDGKGGTKDASVAEILTSDDYLISEQINAYRQAYTELSKLDAEAAKAFEEEYKALSMMATWDEQTLNLVEDLQLTADEINNISKAMSKLGLEGEEVLTQRFQLLMNNIATSGNNIREAIEATFGDVIGGSKEAYNMILKAYSEAVGIGILNMGQNLDKLGNTVDNFYKKAAEWSTMSEADKAQFINDNADLFTGEGGAELLKAFESGNYAAIEAALQSSTALQKQVNDRIKEIEQELALELAKAKDEQNTAYIQMLEDQLKYLNDSEKLFEVSLETQLEQQNKQLDEYKSYLEEQKSALENSLNKRKEAYEKYFDAIGREEEDEDYEEQANTLISNLSKLSTSTSADAKKQSKELENQMKELEEERLKTLRERAQEAIIENMDDTLDEINDKFDELINSNKALLAAMNGDLANGEEFIAKLMADKISKGATEVDLESYWQELESIYGSALGDFNWDNFDVKESGNSMYLNVNGQTIELSPGNQQSVYEVIMKALRQVGVN